MAAAKDFDFNSPVELYCQRQRGRRAMIYRRFATAAAAIRYAVETLTPGDLVGCMLEMDGKRYEWKELKQLYEHQHFPIKRAAFRKTRD